MTRRKQNYPQRLKGSCSTGDVSQDQEDSMGGDSPMDTDDEERDNNTVNEDDGHSRSPPHVTECIANSDSGKGHATIDSDDTSKNPVSELTAENSRVSPILPTPSTSSPSVSTAGAMVSLSNVAANVQTIEKQNKERVIQENEDNTLKAIAKNISGPKKHSHSPDSLSSEVSDSLSMTGLGRSRLTSHEGHFSKRASSVIKNHNHCHEHSSFYEKLAARALDAAKLTSSAAMEVDADQPLDLSWKSSRPRSISDPDPPSASRRDRRNGIAQGTAGKSVDGSAASGISSLQSLQNRFGGDFLVGSPQHSSRGIPLQPTILPSKPVLGSGLSQFDVAAAIAASSVHNHHHQQKQPHHHHSTTVTSKTMSTRNEKDDSRRKPWSCSPVTNGSSLKGLDPQENSEAPKNMDSAKAEKSVVSVSESDTESKVSEGESKYTTHRCSCHKSFGTLYALSAHLQETGHTPSSSKQTTLMDYPKLVRGQDMWLNQESEQTRRILRCMQCGESFKSLPMLTVHMMQTQHYSKIVSAEHGRRSHKCSAYCDRESDKECIFKCKVCQEAFSDMEGLANHMVMSGHHKKQVLRSHNYSDLAIYHSRNKRYLNGELSKSCGSLSDYKRKYSSGSGGSNGYLHHLQDAGESVSATDDGTVTCESCGKKFRVHDFLEHIHSCLCQRAEVINALKIKLCNEDSVSNKQGESPPLLEEKRESPCVQEQDLASIRDSPVNVVKSLNYQNADPPGKESVCRYTDACDRNTDNLSLDNEKSDSSEAGKRKAESESHSTTQIQAKDNVEDYDSGETNVKSTQDTDVHPKFPEDLTDHSSTCLSDKTTDSPSQRADKEKCTEQKSLSEETQDQSLPDSDKDEASVQPKMDVSLRISSPAMDEDKAQELSHSPQSGCSLSGDSKPTSPLQTTFNTLSSPVVNLDPSKSMAPSKAFYSPKQSLKRQQTEENDSVELKNLKKIKLEESCFEDQKDVDGEDFMEKIKSDNYDDDNDKKRSSQAKCETPVKEIETEMCRKGSGDERDQRLNVIDPNSAGPANSGEHSALKAMESFIKRSFSSKFESRQSFGSDRIGAQGVSGHAITVQGVNKMVSESASSPLCPSSMNTLSYISEFFPSVLPSFPKHLDAAMDTSLPCSEKNKLSVNSVKSAEPLNKNKTASKNTHNGKQKFADAASKVNGQKRNKNKASDTKSSSCHEGRKEEENGKERCGDEQKHQVSAAHLALQEEDLANKYLNIDEEEKPEDKKTTVDEGDAATGKASPCNGVGKKSALDSLSSFVHSQPMSSEHPLDSLQRLFTQTSIPKMMSAAVVALPRFKSHHQPYTAEQVMEKMYCAPAEASISASTMPLNLSRKGDNRGNSGGDEDHVDYCSNSASPCTSHDIDERNSTLDAVIPEGEATEYQCTACTRRFVSKGSYRYHQSRCPLSSVKQCTVKEAFSMSPYVYLPLDHTAKFTKYYQMAQEFASKETDLDKH